MLWGFLRVGGACMCWVATLLRHGGAYHCLISAGKFPKMYPTPSPSRRLPHPPRLEAVAAQNARVF